MNGGRCWGDEPARCLSDSFIRTGWCFHRKERKKNKKHSTGHGRLKLRRTGKQQPIWFASLDTTDGDFSQSGGPTFTFLPKLCACCRHHTDIWNKFSKNWKNIPSVSGLPWLLIISRRTFRFEGNPSAVRSDKNTIGLLSFPQVEGVCFSADRRHISFLRAVSIAQCGILKFCLLSLINPHWEQNTWPRREPGPLTCGPATGHISKSQTKKCFGPGLKCVRSHLFRFLNGFRRLPDGSIRFPPSADITCWTLRSFSATPPSSPSTTTHFHTLWILLTSHIKEVARLTAEIPLTLQSTWSLTKVQTKRSECLGHRLRKNKKIKSTWAQPRHSLHHFSCSCFSFNNSVEVFNLWQVVLVYVGLFLFLFQLVIVTWHARWNKVPQICWIYYTHLPGK